MARQDGTGGQISTLTIFIAMNHYKIQKLSGADIDRLEKASSKGAATAKEIRGLLKDIEKAGDTDMEELLELYAEMDESLYGIFEDEAGQPKSADVAKKVSSKARQKAAAGKRVATKGVGSAARHKAKMHVSSTKSSSTPEKWDDEVINHIEKKLKVTRSDAQGFFDTESFYRSQAWAKGLTPAKAYEYMAEKAGWEKWTGGADYSRLKVSIRPKSPTSKMFIVWDEKTDQIFANEYFKSVAEAKKFAEENQMVVVGDTTKAASKQRAAGKPAAKAKGPLRGAAKAKSEDKAKREALVRKTLAREDLKKLSESEVLAIARQFNDLRSGAKRDESTASKQRVSATPENLIRWMRNPGGFDLIGIDSARATTPTANLKMDVGSWFNRFVHNKKD